MRQVMGLKTPICLFLVTFAGVLREILDIYHDMQTWLSYYRVFRWRQYVVFAHLILCCPVGYVERGGLTSRDRLNSSDNYLL